MQIITNQNQKEIKEHGNYSFPVLVSYEALSNYESGSFLWHWHPEIEITLVTHGEMLYHINHDTFHLKEGQILFGNSNVLHSGQRYRHMDCSYTSITFDPKLLYGYENSLINIRYVRPLTQNHQISSIFLDQSCPWHQTGAEIIRHLLNIWQSKAEAYELEILSDLLRFWKLLTIHSKTALKSDTTDQRSYDRIRDILSYIEENYQRKLALEEIAGQIHLCRSECCRIFKKYMNLSLFDFILDYRIEKSLKLLGNTRYSVKEISENVGFNDSNYFSKVFHQRKGMSPSAYRKNLLSSVSSAQTSRDRADSIFPSD